MASKIKVKINKSKAEVNPPSVPESENIPVKEQESKPEVKADTAITLNPEIKPEELKDLEKQFKKQEATLVVPVPKAVPREALLEAKMDRLTEEVIKLRDTLLKILDNQPKRLNLDFLKK